MEEARGSQKVEVVAMGLGEQRSTAQEGTAHPLQNNQTFPQQQYRLRQTVRTNLQTQ